MKQRIRRCLFAIVIVLSSAPPAHADMMGFWRWWDSLSGPGPFNGLVVELNSHTVTRESGGIKIHFDPAGELFLADRSALRVGFQLGVLKAEDNNLPYADGRTPPGVWAIPISVTADRNLKPGIDVGAGLGVVRFTGDDFGFWRTTVSPRLSIAPASLLARNRSRQNEAFKIRLFFTAVLGEFDAGDFGAVGDFKGGNELLFGTTFSVDVLALKK